MASRFNFFFFLIAVIPALLLWIFITQAGAIGFGAVAGIIVFILGTLFIVRYNINVLGVSILVLGLSPFYLGLDVRGGIPKIFLDQAIFLLYMPYFVFTYFILKRKTFSTGGILLSVTFAIFLFFQGLSFIANPTFYIAVRNFMETFVFGIILFYIFYNETDTSTTENIINFIIAVTLILSMIIIIETIAGKNPVLENVTDFLYISPQVAARAEGVYRPYATFFNPSEAGTFIAMGIPFMVYKARFIQPVRSFFLLGITIVAVILNYTRGVWIALLLSLIIFSTPIRRGLVFLSPVIALAAVVLIAVFSGHPFIQRLTDPENLLARFFYWDLALSIFEHHKMLGIGHLNFKETYMSFVSGVDPGLGIDIKEIFVADNMLLTTLIEHGILGIAALLLLFSVVFYTLIKHYLYLKKNNDDTNRLRLKACIISVCIFIAAGLLADVHQFTKATKYLFIIIALGMSIIKTTEHSKNDENPR